MTITFNKIIEFNSPVFRNIQGISLEFNEFDDLTTNPKAKMYAHRAAIFSQSQIKLNDLQYHAIDFLFEQKTWLPTRFGDGAYPVWYGAVDLKTNFYETLYHWCRTYLEAPQDFNREIDSSIRTLRTVFTVNCQAALIDLRDESNQKNNLFHPDLASYPYTQQIGRRIHREGYPGLITKSARIEEGENVAAFKKSILSIPKHYQNYIYEYNSHSHIAIIKRQDSNKVVFEDHVPVVLSSRKG